MVSGTEKRIYTVSGNRWTLRPALADASAGCFFVEKTIKMSDSYRQKYLKYAGFTDEIFDIGSFTRESVVERPP